MPRTVLVVEDDDASRAMYRDVLVEGGYRVLTATQGAEGVHLARRHHPDLILLDVRMPVMDGWAVARYLKSDPATLGIPVVALSAFPRAEEDPGPWDAPKFDHFLEKPIAPGRLIAEVESWIGPPDTEPGPPPMPTLE